MQRRSCFHFIAAYHVRVLTSLMLVMVTCSICGLLHGMACEIR